MCFLKEKRTVELLLPLHEHAQGSASTCSVCFIRVVFRFFKERGRGEESSLVVLHGAISSSRKDGAWLLRILHVRTITYQNNPWRKAKIKNIVLYRHKHTVLVQSTGVFLCVQGVWCEKVQSSTLFIVFPVGSNNLLSQSVCGTGQ